MNVWDKTCHKCGQTKPKRVHFTIGYSWCNECLGKKSRFPQYSKEELSNTEMQVCSTCKRLLKKEYFDLKKYITEMVPRYGKSCKFCSDAQKERIKLKKEEIREREFVVAYEERSNRQRYEKIGTPLQQIEALLKVFKSRDFQWRMKNHIYNSHKSSH